jgi:hypothetical protein
VNALGSGLSLAAIDNAEAVAWICLVVGIVLLLAGVTIGLVLSLRAAPKAEEGKIAEAKQKIEDAQAQIQYAAQPAALEAGGAAASADAASASAEAAKSALEQVEGIVGSLPENLRFSGMLVLVGAVLMSVATIQFGGVSLF